MQCSADKSIPSLYVVSTVLWSNLHVLYMILEQILVLLVDPFAVHWAESGVTQVIFRRHVFGGIDDILNLNVECHLVQEVDTLFLKLVDALK